MLTIFHWQKVPKAKDLNFFNAFKITLLCEAATNSFFFIYFILIWFMYNFVK